MSITVKHPNHLISLATPVWCADITPVWCPPYVEEQRYSLECLPLEIRDLIVKECSGSFKVSPRNKSSHCGQSGLRSLLRVNRAFYESSVPVLYQHLKLRCTGDTFPHALEFLLTRGHMLRTCRTLTLCIGKRGEISQQYKAQLLSLVSRIVKSMPALVGLDLSPEEERGMNYFWYHSLIETFRQYAGDGPQFILPLEGVRRLRLHAWPWRFGASQPQVTSFLPDLECVSFGQYWPMYEELGNLGNGWSIDDLTGIVSYLPKLRRLQLTGHLWKVKITKLAPVLRDLQDLEFLAITTDPYIWPGAIAHRNHTARRRYENTRPSLEPHSKIVTEVFEHCWKLRKLYLQRREQTFFYSRAGDVLMDHNDKRCQSRFAWPDILGDE